MMPTARSESPQLDFFALLDPAPALPTAQLIAFPACRMLGAARDAAAEILALPKARRQGKLSFEVMLLRLRLLRQQFPSVEIERQTGDFRTLIIREVTRQTVSGRVVENEDRA